MMDVLTDASVEQVVLMTSARIGKTQACINNLVGFHASMDPCNILIVLPTEQRAEEWSDDEFSPMVRDTPILREIFGDRKSRAAKDRRKHKTFPGGRLYVVGANAPSGLAAKTIRILCCDEVDRYPSSAGGEGDVIALAKKRTVTAWNRKVVLSSTPTIDGHSRIAKAYAESDQRRYWVPCPHCGETQVIRWEQVRWEHDDPDTAAYYCFDCGSAWSDAQRWGAVRKGEWRAESPFRGIAGFHINELSSPWRRISETVADFLEAKRGGPEQLMVWKNTALGEVWQEQGEAPDWERLIERREPFPMGVVPRGALILTAGVDNQNDRLELSVWAWAAGYESWLIDVRAFYGHPGQNAVWDELAAALAKHWPREGGGSMRIARIGIDTGGSYTSAAYGQIRRLRDPRIVPLKGMGGWNRSSPVTGPTMVDVTEAGKKIKRGLRLWTVSVDVFKADLYRRLWLSRGDGAGFPPGWVHLPEGLDPEHVKQLVAEQLVTVKDRRGFSRMEWRKIRDRNEQLDMAGYARAALSVLGSDRYGERFWARLKKPLQIPLPPAPAAPQPVIQGPVYTPPPAVSAPVRESGPVKTTQAPRRGGFARRLAGA